MAEKPTAERFNFKTVTPEQWGELEELFGPRGATGGCWCMWFRLPNKDFETMKGEGNHRAMKGIVDSGEVPGILAYVEGQPVGWCSVAPRDRFSRLERSRVAKRIDEEEVWSVVCFFIHKDYRGQGVSKALLDAAVEYAKAQGAQIIEGYPVEPKKEKMPEVFAYYGLAATFKAAGFEEVARRTETRPFMRYYVGQ